MKFVIANWKMNGDLALVREFVEGIKDIPSDRKIIICPPAALITLFDTSTSFNVSCNKEKAFSIGAQNCFYEKAGAFTGENSPALLKAIGCEYVILGHSERRAIFNELDEIVFKKWNAAVSQNLTPILCIGETANQRTNWKDVLSKQLSNYREKNSKDSFDLRGTIFAYEPVWSIGTGKVPSTEEIGEVVNFVKNALGSSSRNYYVVYGGSVNGNNAASILNINGLDGVLVGSASLKLDEFKKIMI
ncbi:MAG: triose-phosphate isomerase [Alphaproteobacteria bacterium]|nr:triose-phosphate isomerase [Alphaproteobacteria bacterium]